MAHCLALLNRDSHCSWPSRQNRITQGAVMIAKDNADTLQEHQAGSLQAAKRRAGAWLAAAALGLALTIAAGEGVWTGLIRAACEAALVGGLADWFAVYALFHRIPFGPGWLQDHSAIIPSNKDRIGENLAAFVQRRFLDPGSLVRLYRTLNPVRFVVRTMADRPAVEQFARHLRPFLEYVLDGLDDASVRALLADALRASGSRLDVSRLAGRLLEAVHSSAEFPKLLDRVLSLVLVRLSQPEVREFVARRFVGWLKSEHRRKEKFLPSEALGAWVGEALVHQLESLLSELLGNPQHPLKRNLDDGIAQTIRRLHDDPEWLRAGERLRDTILGGDDAARHVRALWEHALAALRRDVRSDDSLVLGIAVDATVWLGQRIGTDRSLRRKFSNGLEGLVRERAPEFVRLLAAQMVDQMRAWDARDFSRQIELNIGTELQAIRVNGTIVGGAIGVLIWVVSNGALVVMGVFRG
jgi:uncharacterized membrane-anchored protein YjiN (DUF445 family)